MPRFIEVTEQGQRAWVNFDKVVLFQRSSFAGTFIQISETHYFTVDETLSEILEKLEIGQ